MMWSGTDQSTPGSQDRPERFTPEQMAWLTSHLTVDETAEIRTLTMGALNEVTTTRGTPVALATIGGMYLAHRRGFFDKWHPIRRGFFFATFPVMTLLTADLLFIRNHPKSAQVQERLRDFYVKHITEAATVGQGSSPDGRGAGGGGGGLISYAQLREANRSGRPMPIRRQQQPTHGSGGGEDWQPAGGDKRDPRALAAPLLPDESYGSAKSWRETPPPMDTTYRAGGYMSGTPLSHPAPPPPYATAGPGSGKREEDKWAGGGQYGDTPSSDFGFEMLPGTSTSSSSSYSSSPSGGFDSAEDKYGYGGPLKEQQYPQQRGGGAGRTERDRRGAGSGGISF